MQRFVLAFFVIVIFNSISPYIVSGQINSHKTFLIKFTDKNNSPYSLAEPLDYLSQRALNRRIRMQIDINEQDIPVNPSYLDSLKSAGAIVHFTSKWLNTATVSVDTELVIKTILKFPFVKKTERIYRSLDVNLESTISTSALNAWETDPVYGQSYNQIKMLNGHLLHEKGYNGDGVVIAIIDAGFNRIDSLDAFSYLFANNRILATHDFVDGDDQVFSHHSHGMYVLSTIAGKIWGKLIGTAPEASFILLRSENADSEYIIEEDAWIAAAEFADSAGADVINSSLGYSVFNDSNMNHSYADYDGNTIRVSIGADVAASKGLIVVNSAGNEGNDPWLHITAPSDADSILTIGAVDETGQYAPFSSIGPSSDGDVKPNVVAQGMNAVVATNKDGIVGLINGTSLSSPIIAGMVACLVQAFPDKTNMEIIRAIEKSAHLYPKPDVYYGYGIPDFDLAFTYLKMTEDELSASIELLELYPNPFQNGLVLSLYSKEANELVISINSVTGQNYYQENLMVQAQSLEKFYIHLSQKMLPGLYVLSVANGDEILQKKIVRM
ncbi:MAG: S8 family serine peptidase [Bacteroidetes bacterium]|nr:S8 family serine peptidase [Bacteroidota bacterium]MBT6836354.1 S8 family serine peptidase [Bacteroidota bacterium]